MDKYEQGRVFTSFTAASLEQQDTGTIPYLWFTDRDASFCTKTRRFKERSNTSRPIKIENVSPNFCTSVKLTLITSWGKKIESSSHFDGQDVIQKGKSLGCAVAGAEMILLLAIDNDLWGTTNRVTISIESTNSYNQINKQRYEILRENDIWFISHI